MRMMSYCTVCEVVIQFCIAPTLCPGATYQNTMYMKLKNTTYFGMSCAVLHPITIAILQRGSPAPEEIQSQVFSRTRDSLMFETNSLITTAPPLPAIDNNFVSFSSYLTLHVCCIR